MSEITAKQIKDAFMDEDVRKEKHTVPDTELEVWVHELSSYQLETWRQWCRSDDENARSLNAAKLLQLALHDEAGGPVWGDKEVAILAGRPARLIEPLVKVVLRLSGYGAEGDLAILKNLTKILGAGGLSDLLGSKDAASEISSEDTQPESSESST